MTLLDIYFQVTLLDLLLTSFDAHVTSLGPMEALLSIKVTSLGQKMTIGLHSELIGLISDLIGLYCDLIGLPVTSMGTLVVLSLT